jgi:hypothetical protein
VLKTLLTVVEQIRKLCTFENNFKISIMKLSNIFKKENKTVAKANVEKLAKNQLEKVIGGGDDKDTSVDPLKTTINTTRSNIKSR